MLVTFIGVIYSWRLYSLFGVNVFDFAEANDFLLAALKEPFAFLMSVITLGLVAAQIVWFLVRRKRRPLNQGGCQGKCG